MIRESYSQSSCSDVHAGNQPVSHSLHRSVFIKCFLPLPLKTGLFLLFFLLAARVMSFSQRDTIALTKDTISITGDTVPVPERMPKLSRDSVQALTSSAIKKSVQKNLEEFENDKVVVTQDKFFAELSIELESTHEYLQRGIDSTGLEREINNIIKWYKIAADGVFVNKGTEQTSRNLTITHIILTEAAKRLDTRSEKINGYLDELNQHKKKLDSLLSDSILLNIPKDSAAFADFFEKAVHAGSEINKIYRNLKNTINTVQELNVRCQVVHNTLRMRLDEVEQYRKSLTRNALKREFGNIWGPVGFVRPIPEILRLSVDKNLVVMGFYFGNHLTDILMMGLLTIGLALFLKYLDKTASKRLADQQDHKLHLVLQKPWLISIFIVLNVCQFFFKNPPFIFYASGWIISCLILSVLFWKKINPRHRLPWVLLVIVFIATSVINSVLQASRSERWVVFFWAICIVALAIFSANRLRKREGYNPFLLIFVGLVIVLETVSAFLNAFGRFNLAKTALTSGVFNLVVMVLLLWTCFYSNEIIKIIARIFKLNASNASAEPIEVIPRGLRKFPTYLSVLLIGGWFMLFMRNFYAFTIFTEPFRDFMDSERKLGSYTFSIQSIFNFFLIMFVATGLSKIISFFSDAQQNTGSGKKGLGSGLLLVRISIFTIALFLAFAAAGIPMDKIAIIFSALSLGIGFGLQTLVNNLVSGLIIAFEKPVNVGDAVDISGQTGTMKSIGFRSSVVSTYDGSDVIIPNGDLLNAHLVNWTLGDTKRRVEVLVGVAYGTDIEKVKGILMNILENEKPILRYPADPMILVKEFGASSIDFRILFWIDTAYNLWSAVKSDVLERIDVEFKKENIKIPFAQQDIHIRSVISEPEVKKTQRS
jgi:potassium efflux system protein